MQKDPRFVSRAMERLTALREQPNNIDLQSLDELIDTAGVTLEELGLTSADYAQLVRTVNLASAKEALHFFRSERHPMYLWGLRDLVATGKVVPEEVGLTKVAYEKLLAENAEALASFDSVRRMVEGIKNL
jgi:hypothetical protein